MKNRGCEVKAKDACVPLAPSKNRKDGPPASEFKKLALRHKRNDSIQAEMGSLCTVSFPFDGNGEGCPAMRRKRLFGVSGSIQVTAVVTVSFHPHFITQIDRMYRIQCMYEPKNETYDKSNTKREPLLRSSIRSTAMVKTAFHVNKNNASRKNARREEPRRVPGPVCRYEILQGGPNGKPAQLSDSLSKQVLYHKWSCDVVRNNSIDYCFLVHTCFAQSANNSKPTMGQRILDERGCSVNKYLLENLVYSAESIPEVPDHSSYIQSRLTAGQLLRKSYNNHEQQTHFKCKIRLWAVRRGSGGQCPDREKLCSKPKKLPTLRRKPIDNDRENNFVQSRRARV
ncbi:cuticlin-1 [Ditylenchus destructor]|nr:cuticlin-1 [Ditylenchus destructor]